MRRRARFLSRARELAYRDLGGLVFEMHRLGQRHDELVAAKLQTLGHIDAELRALQDALGERGAVTVLREAGIAACPRCAAIHGSDDRFCPVCGLPMGRKADRPMAATPPSPAASAPQTAASAPALVSPAALAPALPQAPAPAQPTRALAPPAAIPSPPAPAPAAPPTPQAPVPPQAPTPPPPPPPPAQPPAATQPPRTPAGPDEDRPTEIIRPSDKAGA